MIANALTNYSVPELAKHWRCSVSFVVGLIESGDLKAINLARPESKRAKYVITAQAVQEYQSRRIVTMEREIHRPQFARRTTRMAGHFG